MAAATGRSSSHRVELGDTRSGASACTASTPRVFCTVSAVMHGGAVDSEGLERLQVGLDAGAAARVGAGDA